MSKVLNGQELNGLEFLSSKIFILPTYQCYLEKSDSLNTCFSLFHTPFFISKFIKFQLTPLQLGFCGKEVKKQSSKK